MDLHRQYSRFIKQHAKELGFDFAGISKADQLDDEARHLEEWLSKGMHGEMGYMDRNFEKRVDPRKLVEGTRSVVSLMMNYYPEQHPPEGKLKISRYAWGEDYHHVIKRKLKELLGIIRSEIGDVQGRVFVDSAPVLERAWAKRSGLGWVGKNTNLIHPRAGSYFFIAEMLLDIDLEPDGPMKDYCGTCTRCIDACPTDAIVQPYVVDGSKCISYYTIELKNEIPESAKGTYEDWIFGCDICQEVCPWNKFSLPHKVDAFRPKPELLEWDEHQWMEITSEIFDKTFHDSPIKRTGYEGIRRNIRTLRPDGKPQR
jgi:epoxyqueuosine reductase